MQIQVYKCRGPVGQRSICAAKWRTN